MRGWENVTEADLARMTGRPAKAPAADQPATPKRSKYRNQRVEVPGAGWFDSKREAEHYLVLKARETAGEIRALRRQVRYSLICPSPDRVLNHTVCEYVADFVYVEGDKTMVVDAKGHRTREYLLKRRWLELQEGIEIVEV